MQATTQKKASARFMGDDDGHSAFGSNMYANTTVDVMAHSP
jgi:hypothetical protein